MPKRVSSQIAQNQSIQENIPADLPQQDPLIARGLERDQYIGASAIAVLIILIIGFLSRRIEYALIFALTLSIILIIFFLSV